MKNKPIIGFLLISVLLLTSCAPGTVSPTATAIPSATTAPTITPTPAPSKTGRRTGSLHLGRGVRACLWRKRLLSTV